MTIKNFIASIAIFLTILIFANIAQAKNIQKLNIKTIDGKIFDLNEKHGKITIVNFWAEWCMNCRQELPILNKISQKYQSKNLAKNLAKNLEIIGISIDSKRDRKKVINLTSKLSYTNAMLIDAQENSLGEPDSIPLVYIIDQNGAIAAKLDGDKTAMTEQNIEKILQSLLL